MAKWFETAGNDSDIVISTRVRLARNLKDVPFPARMNETQAADVFARISGALEPEGYSSCHFETADDVQRLALAERRLASRELAAGKLPRGIVVNGDESVCVMVNEEDHVRIQVMGSGLCVEQCLKQARQVDNLLDQKVGFAFHEQLGYLTACPTNLGCGLRMSVMLHLPAMTESGGMRNVVATADKLGLTIRGMYGEGTRAEGAVYQISNALSFGRDEADMAQRLVAAVGRIIEAERALRAKVYAQNRPYFEDRVYRAAALLRNARLLSSQEALGLISDMRFGAGCVENISTAVLDALMWEIQPANITLKGENKTAADRDQTRATVVRERLV